MPSDQHQAIVGYLYALFLAFVQRHGGTIRFAPLRLRLWPGKIREPDLLFMADAADARRQEMWWTGADMVIEVISSDDPQRDLLTKRLEYAQAEIPEYWIVDPRDQSITVLALRGETYQQHGVRSRGDVDFGASSRSAGRCQRRFRCAVSRINEFGWDEAART